MGRIPGVIGAELARNVGITPVQLAEWVLRPELKLFLGVIQLFFPGVKQIRAYFYT